VQKFNLNDVAGSISSHCLELDIGDKLMQINNKNSVVVLCSCYTLLRTGCLVLLCMLLPH